MNAYARLNNMNDRRWSNIMKCDILKFVTDLGDLEEGARHAKMVIDSEAGKQKIKSLKQFIKIYDPVLKEATGNYTDKVLSGTDDKRLAERYSNLHPDKIKASFQLTIHRIDNEANLLVWKIKERREKFEEMRIAMFNQTNEREDTVKHNNLKRTMGRIKEMEKKTALVDYYNRKTEKMVKSYRENLNVYDTYLDQLHTDVASMATNLMKVVEINDRIKADAAGYVASYEEEMKANEKKVLKAFSNIEILNALIDSLEQSRHSVMESSAMTEEEKEFNTLLPVTLDDKSDGFTDTTSKSRSLDDDYLNLWYDLMSEYGIMHFVHPDEPLRLLNNLKNNADPASIDYIWPENVVDYISLHNPEVTADQLAVNYLLHAMHFDAAEDLSRSVSNTKRDLIRLKRFNGVRKSLWRLLIKKDVRAQEAAGNLSLITNQEVEYSKQAELLKSLIDEKQTRISELNEMKAHYIALLNELYFHMLNVKSILKQVNFPVVEPKPSTHDVKFASEDSGPLGTSDVEFSKLINELRSTMYQVDKKIRRCLLIVQEDFTAEKLNFARAVYVYQNQERIQDEYLKKKMELDNFLKRQVESEKPKLSNNIMTRQDMKKQADQIVKYFMEKDTDQSKNKRKPISFRKSFI